MLRQSASGRAVAASRGSSRLARRRCAGGNWLLWDESLESAQPQLDLRGRQIHLLTGAPELPTSIPGELNLQMLDLALLLEHETLEMIDIAWKCVSIEHARIIRADAELPRVSANSLSCTFDYTTSAGGA